MRRRDIPMALLATATGPVLLACGKEPILLLQPAQPQTPNVTGNPPAQAQPTAGAAPATGNSPAQVQPTTSDTSANGNPPAQTPDAIGAPPATGNARTQAEVYAGVMPTNYAYAEGCVNRYGNNTLPGVTDMTAAIKAACSVVKNSSNLPLTFLGQQYLVTDTAISITAADTRITIQGVPFNTTLINKAPAGRPAITLSGAQYFDISGLVLIGVAGFPNIGVEMARDAGGNRCAFGVIKRLVCQTNGGGIHLQDANTVSIEDYSYWPSGGACFGGTIDPNGQPYGILADGTSAVNSVYLQNINISGLNPIADGGCGILIDGSNSSGYFQDWKIDGLNCERSGRRSIWLRNAYLARMQNVFVENTEVRVDQGSTLCEICFWGGAVTKLVIDGTQPLGACSKLHIHDCIGKSITADAANQEIIQTNNCWQVSPGNADSSANRTQVNCRTTGGTLQPDVLGVLGIKERNRAVAMGEWTTPGFSAGNFAAGGGMAWAVSPGNVLTYQWTLVGKMMMVTWSIAGTTLGMPSLVLFIAIPGGFTAAKRVRALCEVLNNAVRTVSTAEVAAGATAVSVYKDNAASTFVAGVIDTYGQIAFEIQ